MVRRTGSGRGRRARSSPLTLGDSVTQSIGMRFSVHTQGAAVTVRSGQPVQSKQARQSTPCETTISCEKTRNPTMKYLLAITLSASEFDLLKVFAENPNRPLQRRGSR